MSRVIEGDTVGGYRLVKRLGRGGTGTVYAAARGAGPPRFAVKVLALDDATRDGPALFERERHLLAEIAHENVVRLLDSGRDAGASYLVMELLEGETLRARLARGRLEGPELARAGRELLAALTAIHARGILHRDLTPANLMLVAGRLVVLDFGLARLVGDATITASRGIRLSLAYAPPERFRGEPQSVASDIYQTGLVLFEMATGRPAVAADDPSRLATAHLMKTAPSARAQVPSLPPLFDHLIARCLRKAPEERYASAPAVLEDWAFLFP